MTRFSIWAGAFNRPRILILSVLAVISIVFTAVPSCPAAQVALSWNQNPEPSVVGYRVYYGTSSRTYTAVIDVGRQTACTISGLVPGVTYFISATAYAGTGYESSFSGEIAYTVPGGSSSTAGSGGGGGCFIATAAFGSSLAPEISVLREFRDRYLLTNGPGQAFVSWYYRVSPPVAALIAEHETLKAAVRWGLTPVVFAAKYPWAAILFIVSLPPALVLRKRACRR
mgnify:CR=1 FL=1